MRSSHLSIVWLAPLALCALVLIAARPGQAYLSRWVAPVALQAAAGGIKGEAVARSIDAEKPPVVAEVTLLDHTEMLERYNSTSSLIDASPGRNIRYYVRQAGAGEIVYFVVQLSERVHVEVINADGAIPGSDATGDTIWIDGQQHLATVAEMAVAPYAAREGMQLYAALAFGFHGSVRTSNEGTVVINGVVHRVNPGRAALCIEPGGTAAIGLFDHQAVQRCAQAIGAGPVILWEGKIANPDVHTATDEFLPFNPLDEDFALLDWRKKIYSGTYPKTAIGIVRDEHGRATLVLATSYNMTGVELARQLREMGCREALGGDDDTSTQAVWRGAPVRDRQVREVPDAVAVYLRTAKE